MYKIAKTVNKIFNIGVEGKTENFLDKVIKQLKSEVTDINHSKQKSVLEFNRDKDNLLDEIEDQKEVVKSSYFEMKEENLETNATQKKFISKYLKNIEKAEEDLETLEDKLYNLKTSHKATMDDYSDEIKNLETRISIISEEVVEA